MSNKETLQNYNTRLVENNISLDTLLEMANELPDGLIYKSMDTYSTDEQLIGIWTDRRPLYRRCIDIGTLSQSNTDINLTEYGIDAHEVKSFEVYKKDPSGVICNITTQFLSMTGGLICRTIVYKDEWINVLRITVGPGNSGDFTTHTGYAILTYTKPDDTPLSPTTSYEPVTKQYVDELFNSIVNGDEVSY